MKTRIQLILLFFISYSFTVFSQDQSELAKAYLSKAKESFELKEYDSAERFIKRAAKYYGEVGDVELASLASDIFMQTKDFESAKKYLQMYFDLEKNKNSKQYKDKVLAFVEVEDQLEIKRDELIAQDEKRIQQEKDSLEALKNKSINSVTTTIAKDTVVKVQVDEVVTEKAVETDSEEQSNVLAGSVEKKQDQKIGTTLIETYKLSKFYFEENKLELAKKNIIRFFELDPPKNTRHYKEMEDLAKKIDAEIVVPDVSAKKVIDNTPKEIVTPPNSQVSNLSEESNQEDKEVENFDLAESVPVYPGCKGENYQLSSCLNINVQKHYAQNFNMDLLKNLNLPAGQIRVTVAFKIAKTGDVIQINSQCIEKALSDEADRVAKMLPKMIPAKSKGKEIDVKFSMPIVFTIQ